MYLLSQAKNGISSLELGRQIGVSPNTAWLVKHKLMQAMLERDAGRKLEGEVQVDDSYLGGERPGGKRGRGSENKTPFLAAVQVTAGGQPVVMKLCPVEAFRKDELPCWLSSPERGEIGAAEGRRGGLAARWPGVRPGNFRYIQVAGWRACEVRDLPPAAPGEMRRARAGKRSTIGATP